MEGKKNKFRKQILALILALAVIFPLSLTGVGGSVSVEAATVALNRTTAMVTVGQSVKLSLTGAPAARVSWRCRNTNIARVSASGTVKGVGLGKTAAIAVYKGKEYICAVDVEPTKKMSKAINKLILVARKEIGYMEKKSLKNLDSKKANAGYGNYTKYSRDAAPYYQGEPWCAIFVSWCMKEAYGLNKAQKLLKDWPYIACRFLPGYLPSYTVPRKGDIVIFHDGIAYNHTGIVTEVHGKQFWTIEGNTRKVGEVIPEGYIVCEKSYDLQKLPNVRFCRPDYTLFQ